MKLYKDQNLSQEIALQDDIITFGRVHAGNKKQLTVYIINDSADILEINEVKINNTEEVKVLSRPEILLARHVGEMLLEWDAKLDLKKGLKGSDIVINATEVFE